MPSSAETQLSAILLRALADGGIEVDDWDLPDVVVPGISRAIELEYLRDRSGAWQSCALYQLTPTGKLALGVRLNWLERVWLWLMAHFSTRP
jgi:hypothetical protein